MPSQDEISHTWPYPREPDYWYQDDHRTKMVEKKRDRKQVLLRESGIKKRKGGLIRRQHEIWVFLKAFCVSP
jgi:hypothetical protein